MPIKYYFFNLFTLYYCHYFADLVYKFALANYTYVKIISLAHVYISKLTEYILIILIY